LTPCRLLGALARRWPDAEINVLALTPKAGGPGLGECFIFIFVLVIGELDSMKHGERLPVAAKPDDVLA
jgi:hypothetical protein